MSDEGVSISQVLERLTGGNRSDEQIAREGAAVIISQIAKLRRQLDQAERATQHVIRFGKTKKDDDAIWKRVRRAANALLDGMPA